ncbi:MAG: hypothetical protein ACT4P6_18035 [Gemmatimonadaceae bacterium]
MRGPSDTSPAAERLIIEGYRRMTPAQKLECVLSLNRALVELASARLRHQYGPDIPPHELRLRLAALRLDAKLMREAFHWDPSLRGL